MKRVRIAAQAIADIDEIAEFIARRDPDRARTFRDELFDRAAAIAQGPMLHSLRDDFGTQVRAARYGRYLLIYTEVSTHIRVERVLHGARDLERAFRRR